MSRCVIITPDPSFDERLRSAAASIFPSKIRTFLTDILPGDPGQLFAALGSQPEVVVLGPDLLMDDALRLATLFDMHHPEISLVFVGDLDPDQVVQAMRSGIRDVLPPTADARQMHLVLERAAETHIARKRTFQAVPQAQQGRGLVIGIFSPKGGVGKTTVATNLAVGLGKLAPMGVVLVDLDLQFGDVASGLYLKPEHSVLDAVSASASLDPLVLKAFLTVHPSGIYALCAPANPADADLVSPDQVRHLLDQLSLIFQYVVVDTAPGLPELGLTAMEACTDVVWVTGMDVPSVRGLRSGLDVLNRLDILPSDRHVVLNSADAKTGLSVADIEATIGAPVDVSIPRSKAVAFSTNRGVPVISGAKNDRASKSLQRLIQRFDPAWRSATQRKSHRRVVVR